MWAEAIEDRVSTAANPCCPTDFGLNKNILARVRVCQRLLILAALLTKK